MKSKKRIFSKLQQSTIFSIITNPLLKLKDENQLLRFINDLYSKDEESSELYEEVLHENCSSTTISEFVDTVNFNDITSQIWHRITNRVKCEVKNDEELDKERYASQPTRGITFNKPTNDEFKGIINYIRNKSSNIIENEINITASSCFSSNEHCRPINAVLFENDNKFFESGCDKPNNWLCFDSRTTE